MNQLGGFPILTLLVFFPILGGAAIRLSRARRKDTVKWLALLTSAASLFISLFLYMGWIDDPNGGLQFTDGPWLWTETLPITLHFGVDGLNLFWVLLTTLLVPIAQLATLALPDALPTSKRLAIWTLVLEGCLIGALVSVCLATFAIFWILTLVAAWFLVNSPQHPIRTTAGMSGAILISAVLLLAAVSFLSARTQELGAALSAQEEAWIFWAVLLSMCASCACFPFHSWFIQAQRDAPPVARILVSGLLPNLGFYGLARFCLSSWPAVAQGAAPLLVLCGMVGILVSAVAVCRQKTLDHTLAWWNILQINLALAALFSSSHLGVQGAVVLMASRGLAIATLFVLAERRNEGHTCGLAGDRLAFALAFLSAIGAPGLAGFAGQSAALLGVLELHWHWSRTTATNRASDWITYAAFGTGLFLGSWGLLCAWKRISFVPAARLSRRFLIAIPLLACIILLGLSGENTMEIVGPTVHRLLSNTEPASLAPFLPPLCSPAANPLVWRLDHETLGTYDVLPPQSDRSAW